MNAHQARSQSLKNIEQVLWEQLSDEMRNAITNAVRSEMQYVSFNVEGKAKRNYYGMADDVRNLKILGYSVYDDSENDRGMEYPARNITVSW